LWTRIEVLSSSFFTSACRLEAALTDLGAKTAVGLSRRQASRYTDPVQRDRYIQLIEQQGRLGWQRAVNYGRRSPGEVAIFWYKKLIGDSLHARTLPTLKTEAKVACKVVNIMTSLGMPVSRRIA
jgi:hypothetical protein